MARVRYLPPFEVEIETLGPRGVGMGIAPDGRPVAVRGAPPGSRVRVHSSGFRKKRWNGRRVAMIRPPADYVEPPCPVFGLCGGCTLQELALPTQRAHKHALAIQEVAAGLGLQPEELAKRVEIHPVRGANLVTGYRNKLEVSFGNKRYVSEADKDQGVSLDGRFAGFHAPGRFDRVVDTESCSLGSEAMNRAYQAARGVCLADGAPEPYDPKSHAGVLRHLSLRAGRATGDIVVGLYTTSEVPAEFAGRVAAAALDAGATGVFHAINDGVADVTRGDVVAKWGRINVTEVLRDVRFELSPTSFFQTSTQGAEILLDAISEALGDAGGTLLDLYCGIGAIGLCLAERFTRILGVEVVEAAIEDAKRNAASNGIDNAEFTAGKVEDALAMIADQPTATVIVDPPRAGLHPKAARALASHGGGMLVYVACKASSLGRDAAILEAGGWRLTELWTVDLFPHTGHTEMVGRFVR